MGRRILLFNWSDTPLGSIHGWPRFLRTAVSGCLQFPAPLSVSWGPRLTYLYNDAMRPMLGSRHPSALGMPKAEVFTETWEQVGPLNAAVLDRGLTLSPTETARHIDGRRRPTELQYRVSLSPLRDEFGSVRGVLGGAVDVSREVVTRRRRQVLQDLTRLPARARTLQEACGMATSIMAGDHADVRFAMIYILGTNSGSVLLAGCSGLPAATPLSPLHIDLGSVSGPWAIRQVAASGLPLETSTPVRQLRQLREWPAGGPPVTALTAPLVIESGEGPGGFLVLGISPVIPGDAGVSFFELLAGQVATALAAVMSSKTADTRGASDMTVNGDAPAHGSARPRAVDVRASERQRLARDLHDSLTPTLFGIALGAERLVELMRGDADVEVEVAEYVHGLARAALREIRALIFELRPEPLERGGLAMALHELATVLEARQPVRIAVRCDREPECSPQVREAMYRIAQEALANVVQHAHARSVTMDMRSDDGAVTLEIVDDGVGFDTAVDKPGHLGQQSMWERATVLGGSLEVTSQPSGGTKVRAFIPYE
jgi:signal transduction histidine kinase